MTPITGLEIWRSGGAPEIKLEGKDLERWESIQSHCAEVAKFSIQYAKEEEDRWNKTRKEFTTEEETVGC